jgi:hypothetical protein
MNINKIENCLENILDKLYKDIKGDIKKKITIKDINKIIEKHIEIINLEIIEIIKDNEKIKNIILIFTKLIYIYVLILIHNNYELIEFKNLLTSFKDIKSEINSEIISKILKFSKIIDNLKFVINNIENIRDKKIKMNIDDLTETTILINELGLEIIGDIGEIDNYHNIIKYIVYKKIYLEEDKIKIYKLIEKDEFDNLEFKYIEIIETNIDIIDYSSVESLFKFRDNIFSENIYNMINDYTLISSDYNIDDKINILFEKKLLIPITDEFLRYHKDNEKYDIEISKTNINVKTKKENTKIKYIISKIGDVMDIYKKDNEKVKDKLFYQPLIYRKAVLINDLEELGIIKKLQNLNKIQKEQHEYFNELLSYRIYPYINFKDFKYNGFTLTFNKIIDTIRYVNFEYKNDGKYTHLYNNPVQWRIVSNNMEAQIVGVAMPYEISLLLDNNSRNHDTIIQCINLSNTYNIKKISNNGYKVIIKLLKNSILDNIRYKKLPYWIFNRKRDKIETIDDNELENLSQEEYYKFLLEKIYNELINITYDKIVNNIMSSKFESFKASFKMINNIQTRLLEIDNTMKNKIESLLFLKKSLFYNDEYDILEDKIPGITTELIKIPSIPEKEKKKIIINITEKKTYNDEEYINIYDKAICQHNITWMNITGYRKKDPNKFIQELYIFFNKYIIENSEKDFICKSCSEVINIKKYMNDWTSSTEEGIALSVSLNAQLEDLAEYEKYNKSIKMMDKIIEKVCSGLGINILVGNLPQIKLKRQEIIKNVIDLINIEYETFQKLDIEKKKKRAEEASNTYKFSKTLSQFFLFELKNEIFTYSSKDTDKFKKPKLNNIMMYILLLLLNEMTTSIIYFLPYDKQLNYFIFDKIGYNLFDNIYIHINSSNDITLIKNYKLLCYNIYYIAGIIIKYNLWFSDSEIKSKNVINPTDLKIIIHSVCDLLNSILRKGIKKNNSFIYQMFSNKFYSKIYQLYSKASSTDIINNLNETIKKKIYISTDKKIIYKTTKNVINTYLDGKYIEIDYGTNKFNKINYNIKKIEIDKNDKILEQFYEKYYKIFLNNIINNYNIDGSKKNNNEIKQDIKIDESKTFKLYIDLLDKKIKNNVEINNKKNKYLDNIKNDLNNNKMMMEEFKTNIKKDLFNTIDNIIKFFENIIGVNININNENIYLKDNVFIINHDYKGKSRNPIIIIENDKKIIFKKNDEYFKQNIYYYNDIQDNLILYYDAKDLNYLGYKEHGNEYTRVYNTGKILIRNYSIKDKLLYLGFSYLNYEIPENIMQDIEENKKKEIKNNSFKLYNFVINIIRDRIINLKNILLEFQKIFYQIKKKYDNINSHEITKIYINKFENIEYILENDEKVFSRLNDIIETSFFEHLDKNINIIHEQNKLYVSNLLKIKNIDHILMTYLCEEIISVININKDTYTKINLIYLFCNIINFEFNIYNRDYSKSIPDVKKFILLETNLLNIIENDEITLIDTENLTEEEKENLDNEKYDYQEMYDSIDVEIDPTNIDELGDDDDQIASGYLKSELEN